MSSRVVSSPTILLLRRAYTVAAENVKSTGQAAAAASMMRKVADHPNINMQGEVAEGVEKEVFWMRDPKTGNWIPETHFNEIDAAELRAKLLPKKP